MLRYLLFIFIFLFITVTNYGQDFAPIGAKWHYSFPEFSSPNQGYIMIESVKDTIVLGKNAKKLNITHFPPGSSPTSLQSEIIFSDSNKVYLFVYNQFRLLYDFNANQGDTIFVIEPYYSGNNLDTLIPILVDSTKNEIIGGVSKKVQYITSLEPSWYFGSKIIKDIGSDNYLLPIFATVDPSPGPFRCYNDSLLNYQLVNDCEEIITSIDEKSKLQEQVIVYPNPSNGSFKFGINAPFQEAKLTIFDITGKVIVEQKITQNNTQLNLLSHPKGMHFYQLLTDGKQVTGKLIVQ
jgi:hypothetical protein